MIKIVPKQLQFKHPAGTSRGVYTTRDVWYLHISLPEFPGRVGIGECAPLPDLSADYSADYAQILAGLCEKVDQANCFPKIDFTPHTSYSACQSPKVVGYYLLKAVPELRNYPSILFGLETAYTHLFTGVYNFYDTDFGNGWKGIPINGLIWMGDYEYMKKQIDAKLEAGFKCLKLKIGAIDFEQELSLIKHIRDRYHAGDLELRLDANGAFSPDDALEKLDRISYFAVHSVEQPIRAGQWEKMASLINESDVCIALDEELIGHHTVDEKRDLMSFLKPEYIVLKPSLHGGFYGCYEWMQEAEAVDTEWWVTSALESNIGLNSIAQWLGMFRIEEAQGLGTGELFTKNIDIPIGLIDDSLWWKGGE